MILPLHLLLVGNEPADPVLDALRRVGFDPRPSYAATPEAVGVALERRAWDAVLVCSGGEPVGDGDSLWDVVGWVQRRSSPPPLIVVAGAVDAAEAVALMGEGVWEVVGMDELGRLGVAVARAVRHRRAPLSEGAGAAENSENAFFALAEHMPVGLYRSTEDGRILYANPALARMLGHGAVEDLLGTPVVTSLKYPREDFARQIAETGEVRGFEMAWRRADGREIVTRETARAVRDAAGALLYFEGTMEDVTEERRALGSERRRVEQLEAIVRFSAAVDAARDYEALYRAVIRVVEDTMQADVAVLVGQGEDDFDIQAWSSSISDDEVRICREEEVWQAYAIHTRPVLVRDERAVEEPKLVAPLRAFMRRNGLRALGSFPLLHRGHPLGALVVFLREPHTFSEGELRMAETLAWHVAAALSRWQAESELRDSEATLRTITETTGHVPYRLRFGADVYDHLSPSVERLTGYTPEQLQAAGGLDALTETYRALEGEALREGAADVSHYLALHHLRTASGDLRWVEDSAYPWVDEGGHTIGLVGVLRDVTDRYEREAAAREQAQRNLSQQRALNELSTLDADPDRVVRRAVEVAAETTGTARAGVWLRDDEAGVLQCRALYTAAEASHDPGCGASIPAGVGTSMLEQHRVVAIADLQEHPPDPALDLEAYLERFDIRAVLVAPVRRQGQVVGFVSLEHLEAPREWTLDERDFAGALADLVALTLEREQRAHAEAALRESERRYRALSTLGSDYAFALHIEPGWANRIAWATDAFERITGYAPGELADAAGLLGIAHGDDRAACETIVRKLIAGRTAEVELRLITKSGEERWICHRSMPVLDEEGRLRQVYATGQDITDRKRFEAALVEARERAEAMAKNKSTFLANMSHEIRTPLTGIIGFAGVLAEEVGPEQQDFARLIERSGRRLLETINSVLDLARLESEGLDPTPEPLDVVEEARQAVLLLSSLAEQKGLTLRLQPGAEEVWVSADPTCLHRVFNNLVGNAIKFTEGGEVGVEVRAEAGAARITVWDTGVGIDAEFLPHLFSEFRQESKKNKQEGSGLGLAITKRLVELMEGSIGVESTKGEGSRFTMTLPLLPERPGEPAPPDDRSSPDDHAAPDGEPDEAEADEAEAEVRAAQEVGAAPSERAPAAPSPAASAESEARNETTAAAAATREGSVGAVDVQPEAEPPQVVWGARGDGAPADSPVAGDAPSTGMASDVTSVADGVRVLVVTDRDEVRERFIEGDAGASVEIVAEARAALDRMAKERYDVLVLDVNLGGKQTGPGVLRVARTLPGYDGTFAVALGAAGDARDGLLDAGFDACIGGPLTRRALRDVVDRAAPGALPA